jgi:hypothetical protein
MGCGHEDTVELFGKTADRERKIDWFKSEGMCKECYRKQKEAKDMTKITFNSKRGKEYTINLNLDGTEKQKKYAHDLLEKCVHNYNNRLNDQDSEKVVKQIESMRESHKVIEKLSKIY